MPSACPATPRPCPHLRSGRPSSGLHGGDEWSKTIRPLHKFSSHERACMQPGNSSSGCSPGRAVSHPGAPATHLHGCAALRPAGEQGGIEDQLAAAGSSLLAAAAGLQQQEGGKQGGGLRSRGGASLQSPPSGAYITPSPTRLPPRRAPLRSQRHAHLQQAAAATEQPVGRDARLTKHPSSAEGLGSSAPRRGFCPVGKDNKPCVRAVRVGRETRSETLAQEGGGGAAASPVHTPPRRAPCP